MSADAENELVHWLGSMVEHGGEAFAWALGTALNHPGSAILVGLAAVVVFFGRRKKR